MFFKFCPKCLLGTLWSFLTWKARTPEGGWAVYECSRCQIMRSMRWEGK